jgi:hypothetical protein
LSSHLLDLLSKKGIDLRLRRSSADRLIWCLQFLFCFFVPLIISDHEVHDLPELHLPDVLHAEAALDACQNDVVKPYFSSG